MAETMLIWLHDQTQIFFSALTAAHHSEVAHVRSSHLDTHERRHDGDASILIAISAAQSNAVPYLTVTHCR